MLSRRKFLSALASGGTVTAEAETLRGTLTKAMYAVPAMPKFAPRIEFVHPLNFTADMLNGVEARDHN